MVGEVADDDMIMKDSDEKIARYTSCEDCCSQTTLISIGRFEKGTKLSIAGTCYGM